jgi:prophage maintenance system killer protein
MLSLEPEIEAEFDRALSSLPDGDDPIGQHSLGVRDVLRAHYLVANHFFLEGEGLGGVGPRDIGLLYSAVYRQDISFGGTPKWVNQFDVCATLFFGLIKNHPFHDANKRTALLSMLYQLYRAGWCPSVSEKQIEDFTVEIAENNLARFARYRELRTQKDADAEVKYISWYIKNNTRRIDNAPRSVTYRELQAILNKYGFYLENPEGNYIDVVKYKEQTRKQLFGFIKRTESVRIRVGQIGFPRWTAQVSKSVLKGVREMTALTAKNGVDSRAFFEGLDSMQALINTYHTPLMRLAFR